VRLQDYVAVLRGDGAEGEEKLSGRGSERLPELNEPLPRLEAGFMQFTLYNHLG